MISHYPLTDSITACTLQMQNFIAVVSPFFVEAETY